MKAAASIVFVHKDFSRSGGVERVSINLARQFRADGHRVSFFVAGAETEVTRELALEFPLVAVSGSFRTKWRALVAALRDCSADYAIAAKEQANILLWLASWRYRRVKPVFARHCAFDVSDQKLSPGMIGLLYNLYTVGRGRIVSVSSALAKDIRRRLWFGKRAVAVCLNPVVSPEMQRLAVTNTESFSHPRPFICGVGRLCEQKGFDRLLEAYAMLVAREPQSPDLVLVGDGPDRPQLEQQAERLGLTGRVRFAGFTRNPYYVMAQSSLFVLSSRHEGLPTVLIEALALQVPTVAFDCETGPREILEDGQFGYLVRQNDIAGLCQAMMSALSQPRRAPAVAVAPYAYEAAAASYYRVFAN